MVQYKMSLATTLKTPHINMGGYEANTRLEIMMIHYLHNDNPFFTPHETQTGTHYEAI